MKAILESLHLENFKGTKDKTYEFGKTTRLSGMNRIGKTTIATAWFWLLADKNYELVSNPNIRPDDVEECVPTSPDPLLSASHARWCKAVHGNILHRS